MADIFNIEEIEGSAEESSGFDLNFRIKRNEYAFEKDDQAWKWTPEKELRLKIIHLRLYRCVSLTFGTYHQLSEHITNFYKAINIGLALFNAFSRRQTNNDHNN